MLLLFIGTIIAFFLVAISFFILILQYSSQIDWQYLLKIDIKYLLFTFIIFFLYHFLDAIRLKTIAEAYKIKYSYLYAFITSLIATFGATVTPAHIGGELIIFFMLKRLGIKNHKIMATIMFKTVSGFSFFIVALPIILIYSISNTLFLRKILVLSLIFIIFLILSLPILFFFKKWKKAGFSRSLKLYCYSLLYFWRYKKKAFLKACFYSILLYFTFLNYAPALLKAFNIDFNLWKIYILQLPLIYAIFSSPTPGGSGVGELGGIAIFNGIIPTSILGLFIILWRFFSQYLGALLGGILFTLIIFLDMKKFKR